MLSEEYERGLIQIAREDQTELNVQDFIGSPNVHFCPHIIGSSPNAFSVPEAILIGRDHNALLGVGVLPPSSCR